MFGFEIIGYVFKMKLDFNIEYCDLKMKIRFDILIVDLQILH